jgi:hypothetical protein
LVQLRNCAWTAENPGAANRLVWARGNVVSHRCPKSIITASSLAFLEQFHIWKELSGLDLFALDARTAEAFLLLDREWRKELQDGEK